MDFKAEKRGRCMKKNRWGKYGVCLMAPLCVLAFFTAFFALFGIYPFGGYSFSWCDMDQQVIPFMAQLKDILNGQGSLFLSMENAGGMNFWGVFLFFLASPFSFLVVFVQKQDLSLFMNVLVVLKLAVCALCASVYFRYKTPRLFTPLQLILSVMYAFCGYGLLYYQNVMWLDIMYLFPLLLMALDLLLQKGRPALYIVVLALCVTMQFYLSYMTVLCVLLFTAAHFCIYREKVQKNTAVLFCISSLLSALLSAPSWLPALLQFFDSARTANVVQSIAQGGFVTHIYTVIPLVLCTAVLLPAFLASFCYLKKDRQIRLYFIMFLLTVIPLVVEPVNKMWHAGNYMSFPARYAYMTAFFGLAMFGHILEQVYSEQAVCLRTKTRLYPAVVLCTAVVLCAAATLVLYRNFENVRAYTKTLWGDGRSFFTLLAVSLILCAGYGLAVFLLQRKKLSAKAAAMGLCILLLCECSLNCAVYIAAARHSDDSYRTVMDLEGKIEDTGFYRVKTEKKLFDVNLLGAMGYNSLNHYSSLTSQDYLKLMKKLGYSSYWMEVSSNGGTLFSDMLLSHQYTVYKGEKENAVYQNKAFSIVRNTACLPPALVTAADLSRQGALPEASRFAVQQALFSSLFGEAQLFEEYAPDRILAVDMQTDSGKKTKLTLDNPEKEGRLSYQIAVKGRQTLYFDCFDKIRPALLEEINDSTSVIVNGVCLTQSYPSQTNNGLLCLGSFESETVQVEIKLKESVCCTSFGIYGLKEEVLDHVLQNAQACAVEVCANRVTARANGEDGQFMFFAIPYNRGFTAQVNGEKAQIFQVYGDFMAVRLPQGSGTVTLTFVPPGLTLGLCLTAGGFLGVFLLFFIRRKPAARQACTGRPAAVLLIVLGSAVFAAVYIAPVVIYLATNVRG